jgi:5'-nucleotidase
MNAGGVRAPMPAGDVTWGDLYRIQPFGNKLMILELTGALLRDAIEHAISGTNPGAHVSGLHVQFDPRRPAGQRVLSMSLDTGEPIDADAVYTVTASDFLSSGTGDGFTALGQALESTATGIVDLDALIAYIRSQPQPLRPPRDERVRSVATDH